MRMTRRPCTHSVQVARRRGLHWHWRSLLWRRSSPKFRRVRTLYVGAHARRGRLGRARRCFVGWTKLRATPARTNSIAVDPSRLPYVSVWATLGPVHQSAMWPTIDWPWLTSLKGCALVAVVPYAHVAPYPPKARSQHSHIPL